MEFAQCTVSLIETDNSYQTTPVQGVCVLVFPDRRVHV
jgi:hypothetical protein